MTASFPSGRWLPQHRRHRTPYRNAGRWTCASNRHIPPLWEKVGRNLRKFGVRHREDICSRSWLSPRRQHDAVQFLRCAFEIERRTDMCRAVGSRPRDDLVLRDRYPVAVDLHLVVSADCSNARRSTISEVATASLGVGPLEGVVETFVPFVVAMAEMSFLRRRVSGKGKKAGETEFQHCGAPM